MAKAKVDMGQMRKDRKKADARSGGGILKLKEGQYLLYVCPPVHEEDPMPYIEVENAFNIGPNNNALTKADNLEDVAPFIEALEAAGKEYDEVREGWELAEAKGADFKTRWCFNVVALGFRRSSAEDFEPLAPLVQKLSCGKQIYDGITDAFFEEGDISNPDKAIFVKVSRKGTGLNTEYKVRIDSDSLKEPVEVDDALWKEVESNCVPGGENDLHAWIAKQLKTPDQVIAIFNGEEISDDDDVERRKATTSKPASTRRRKKREPEPEELEDDEEELDEDFEDEEELDEDFEDEDEDEDEDEEEDEEEEDDEDGDDVDALEAALAERTKKRKKRKK